jgi:hypothetical protein
MGHEAASRLLPSNVEVAYDGLTVSTDESSRPG